MWNKNFVYVLNHLKIFKAVRKTDPRTPHRNKIKKPCWRQLQTSKALLSYGHRDSNHASFSFV